MDNLGLIQQLIARWKAKSPKGFAIITNIALVLTIIVGIPTTLVQLGIDLPEAFDLVINKAVAGASLALAIVLKFTVATPVATERVLTQIDNGVNPETAKASV
jgi:hypothetical protein